MISFDFVVFLKISDCSWFRGFSLRNLRGRTFSPTCNLKERLTNVQSQGNTYVFGRGCDLHVSVFTLASIMDPKLKDYNRILIWNSMDFWVSWYIALVTFFKRRAFGNAGCRRRALGRPRVFVALLQVLHEMRFERSHATFSSSSVGALSNNPSVGLSTLHWLKLTQQRYHAPVRCSAESCDGCLWLLVRVYTSVDEGASRLAPTPRRSEQRNDK